MEIQKFLFTASFAVWGLYLVCHCVGMFQSGWRGEEPKTDYRWDFLYMGFITIIHLLGVWGIAWFMYVT